MNAAPLRHAAVAASLLLAACATVPQREAAPIPQPFAPSAAARRVVLVSFDGLGADALAEQAGLRSFDWLKRAGTAARVLTANPTQTSVAHATILTGAAPDRHGIVANRFRLAGTPATEAVHGLNTELSAETLVEAARRQGKRVGAIAFPTVDAKNERRSADFGLLWSLPQSRPRTVTLARRNFRPEWVPPTWKPRPAKYPSFSPVMRARVDCGAGLTPAVEVQLAVYDTTDDGRENYDALIVETASREVPIDPRGWFALSSRDGGTLKGSWSRISSVAPDLSAATIYCGSISETRAYPDTFRTIVEEEAGFWPGEPDPSAGPEIFREQLDRFSSFLTRAQTAAIRRMSFDLLLAYHPEVDETSHAFLITQPSQKSYSADAVATGAAVRRAALESADRAVAAIAGALDLARDALVVVGDHGGVPVDTEVRVNRWLAENGFADRWRAIASGNVANLYRTSGNADDAALVDALQKSGYFEMVRTKTPASHPNAGDVVAISHPRFLLSSSSEPPLETTPRENGSHGALNTHRELHTVFFAAGAGVPRRDHAEVSQTRIARFVATLLGIDPPRDAE